MTATAMSINHGNKSMPENHAPPTASRNAAINRHHHHHSRNSQSNANVQLDPPLTNFPGINNSSSCVLIATSIANASAPFSIADERESRWFFDKEKLIDKSPNRLAGIDLDKELTYRQLAASFVQEMGCKLQLPTLCVCSAIVYLHRFYVFHTFSRFNYMDMAAAALFLAAKAQECPRKLEYVVKVSHALQHRDDAPLEPKSDKYIEESQKIITLENVLLKTLGFDTDIELPHQDIVRYSQRIKGRYSALDLVNFPKAPRDLAQAAYYLVSQTLHIAPFFCLRYRPSIVACVCIYLACNWAKWEIPEHDGRMFYQYIDSSVTNELLYALSEEFTQYCDKTGDQLKIRQYMGKIKNPKDAAASTSQQQQISIPPPPAPPTPTKNLIRAPVVAVIENVVESPNYMPCSPVYNPVTLKHEVKVELKKEKSIDVIDAVDARPISAMQLDPKLLAPMEGLSPQPLKRVKTEVLDLNQYKERRNILEIQQRMTPNNAPNTPNSGTSALTPQRTAASLATGSSGQPSTTGAAPPPRKSFIPDMSNLSSSAVAPPRSTNPTKQPTLTPSSKSDSIKKVPSSQSLKPNKPPQPGATPQSVVDSSTSQGKPRPPNSSSSASSADRHLTAKERLSSSANVEHKKPPSLSSHHEPKISDDVMKRPSQTDNSKAHHHNQHNQKLSQNVKRQSEHDEHHAAKKISADHHHRHGSSSSSSSSRQKHHDSSLKLAPAPPLPPTSTESRHDQSSIPRHHGSQSSTVINSNNNISRPSSKSGDPVTMVEHRSTKIKQEITSDVAKSSHSTINNLSRPSSRAEYDYRDKHEMSKALLRTVTSSSSKKRENDDRSPVKDAMIKSKKPRRHEDSEEEEGEITEASDDAGSDLLDKSSQSHKQHRSSSTKRSSETAPPAPSIPPPPLPPLPFS